MEDKNNVYKKSVSVKNNSKKTIFTLVNKISPIEENVSVTKKQLLNYFSNNDESKKAIIRVWNQGFSLALIEALLPFNENHIFNFSKEDLSMNINSIDRPAYLLPKNGVLKTSRRNDGLTIIKGCILLMNKMELQPLGENGELPLGCFSLNIKPIKLSAKRFFLWDGLMSVVWDDGMYIWFVGADGMGMDVQYLISNEA